MPTEYYQKIKEKLHKEARKRYQNFSEEKTEKKNINTITNTIKIFLKIKTKDCKT